MAAGAHRLNAGVDRIARTRPDRTRRRCRPAISLAALIAALWIRAPAGSRKNYRRRRGAGLIGRRHFPTVTNYATSGVSGQENVRILFSGPETQGFRGFQPADARLLASGPAAAGRPH